jgi:c-di-GMP-binding flagellar brake protein YcgR
MMNDNEQQSSNTQEPKVPGLIDRGEDFSPYTLSSPVDVQHVLRSLIKSQAMVAVYFNNNVDFIVTTLLGSDAKNGILVFDVGANPEANKKLLSADDCTFTASPEGIKVQFAGKKISETTWQGSPAFMMRLPERVIKLQRREFYRIQTSVANPLSCTFRHPVHGVVQLKVFDISLGGVGLVLPQATSYELFEHYTDCRLDLQDFGEMVVNLQARNIIRVGLKGGKTMLRMGCRFVDLQSRQETILQRVIAQLERERNAILGT